MNNSQFSFCLPPGIAPGGDYEMHPVCACIHPSVCQLVCHADFSKTTAFTHFYPTALKGCQGIVFTHGVQMGGWVDGGKKFVRVVSQKP